ncbi:MAG: Crp/Fnr family transcriptional regulator [Oscillospiraceae bacterium]|nr:Crp/Fnr family transcriptional regulator [Oscillospiraceae bacterium]MDD6145767.1 Crp/Fnr family transcriptional regulator [Oscillospiraceae bacterium]
MVVSEKLISRLSGVAVLGSADQEVLRCVLQQDGYEIKQYKKGEKIYSVESFPLCAGVILSGSARVEKPGSPAVISTLSSGDIFGLASLFAEKDYYVNNITALNECKVLFIARDSFCRLMEKDPGFSVAYIRYLSDRLYFLNKRIEAFTGGSAESRLASYLLKFFTENETDTFTVSMTSLADCLDIGRASLYRALDGLTEKGCIEKRGKTIRLLSAERLKGLSRR